MLAFLLILSGGEYHDEPEHGVVHDQEEARENVLREMDMHSLDSSWVEARTVFLQHRLVDRRVAVVPGTGRTETTDWGMAECFRTK